MASAEVLPSSPPAAAPSTTASPATPPLSTSANGGAQEMFWACLDSFKDETSAKASQTRLKSQGLKTNLWQVDLGAKWRLVPGLRWPVRQPDPGLGEAGSGPLALRSEEALKDLPHSQL